MNSKHEVDNIRVERLLFLDYRLFRNAEIKFSFPLTVLVGINGRGKSSILDALSRHLSWLVSRVEKGKGVGSGLLESDISNFSADISSSQVVATFKVGNALDGDSVQYKSILTAKLAISKSFSSTSVSTNLEDYTKYGEIIREQRKKQKYMNLPLIASYGVERSWVMRKNKRRSKFSADDALEQGKVFSSALMGTKSFQATSFLDWFVSFSKLADNSRDAKKKEKANRSICLMKKVLKEVIPGFENIKLDLSRGVDDLYVEINGTEVLFEQLSDGQRLFVSLVADIVWRLIELNPNRIDPLQGYGIVLVDEVELHLHPTWQQTILPGLIKIFTGLQFIVTTHSPQVLSTVKSDAIRLLNNGAEEQGKVTFQKPLFETKGRESSDVLAEVMQTHPRPEVEEKQWLSECYRLILSTKDEDISRAKDILNKIKDHFGRTSFEYQSLNGMLQGIGKDADEVH